MPQIAFNSQFCEPEIVDSFSAEIAGVNLFLSKTRMGRRYINNVYDLPKVPGFWDAYRDNFDGWVIHHVLGENTLGLMASPDNYWHQPWWALRFMKSGDHIALHLNDDFRDAYYGL